MKNTITLISVILFLSLLSCDRRGAVDENIAKMGVQYVHREGQRLVDRMNEIRHMSGLRGFEHDTILDELCWKIFADNSYRRFFNSVREDSVRTFLLRDGLYDYQYEIQEFMENDSEAFIKDFAKKNAKCLIRVGYFHYQGKHMVVKTNSFLRFSSVNTAMSVKTILGESQQKPVSSIDAVSCIFRAPVEGTYYFQCTASLPMEGEKFKDVPQYEGATVLSPSEFEVGYPYEVEFKSFYPYLYFLILNDKKERIAVFKLLSR